MSEESFTSHLLKGIQKRANAAHGKAQERVRQAAARRELQEQAKRETEKAQLDAEVEKIMACAKEKTPAKRTRATKKLAKPKSSTGGRQSDVNTNPQSAANSVRVNYRAPVKVHASRPPGKIRRDMEYVVRRVKEKKKVQVPHTSDYSDMFGDDFWKGIDLDFAKKSARETAEATECNQKIMAEQQEERARRNRETAEFYREEKELENKGLLDERKKNKRRLQFSERDWVSVGIPIPIHLQKSSAVARLAQDRHSKSRNARKANDHTRAPAAGRKEKIESKAELDERSRRLKERILSIGAPTTRKASNCEGSKKASPSKGEKAVRKSAQMKTKSNALKRRISASDDSEVEESHVGRKGGLSKGSCATEKRSGRRPRKRMRGSLRESNGSDAAVRSSSAGERKRKTLKEDQEWCKEEDDTDVQGDNDEDESDDEDLYDISALDREEARSARIAKMEDRRELERLRQGKREKARRRREFERGRQ